MRDIITIDAVDGVMSCNVSDEEFSRRRQGWQPREHSDNSGAIWKYTQQVGPAVNGAITHPGGAAEIRTYADI